VILTVTLNLAVDVTYHIDRVRWHANNRVTSVGRRAGGKGVNVARVLHGLGREVVVSGLCGGSNGAVARAEMATGGLADAVVSVGGESRTSMVVVPDDGEVIGFSEPGPQVSDAEWRQFNHRYRELVAQADIVVLSGSLPPGVPTDAYAQLTGAARSAGVPVALDASGEALAQALDAGPELVKINAEELADHAPGTDALAGAEQLRREGAGDVVISSGPAGLLALTDGGAWRVAPPERVHGNPTGAGDAATAALVVGMLDGSPWPQRLVDAVALSAAAVHAPLAGSFDAPAYRRYRDEAVAHRLRGPRLESTKKHDGRRGATSP